jgi:hypothetical protein
MIGTEYVDRDVRYGGRVLRVVAVVKKDEAPVRKDLVFCVSRGKGLAMDLSRLLSPRFVPREEAVEAFR